ncbi:MAG: hypothetical protein ISR65_16200 [Bacteriovoracaceae bacterium]|nr:hypothetical protein [Bacteriovoracaceae bacterium]
MKQQYHKIPDKTFKMLTILFCFIGDMVLCSYLYFRYTDYNLYEMTMEEVVKVQAEMGLAQVPPEFQRELFEVLTQTLITVLSFIILFHIMIYTAHAFNKRFARTYLAVITWPASILFFLFGALVVLGAPGIGISFITQSLLYLFVALGLMYKKPASVPNSQNQELKT